MLLLFLRYHGDAVAPPPPPPIVAIIDVVLTIDGVSLGMRQGTMVIKEIVNGRNTFACRVDSRDGSVRPQLGAELVVTESGVRIYGGTIDAAPEESVDATGAHPAISTRVTAEDFNALATRRFVNETIPPGSLKAALTQLMPYLSPYGITLSTAQVDGPNLPELVYQDIRADEVLNNLTVLTGGFLWDVSYDKVLSMAQPVSGGGQNIGEEDDQVIGDIVVEPTLLDFANRVILRAGTGARAIIDDFVGDDVTTKFILTAPRVSDFGYVTILPDIFETLGPLGTATWTYDPADNSITRIAAPAAGATVRFTYVAQFPIRVVSDGGAAPEDLIERVVTAEDVFDRTVAQVLADEYRARFQAGVYRTVRYSSLQRGVHPRQVVTVVSQRRAFEAPCLITDVTIRHVEGPLYVRDVTAVEGTLFQGSWRDTLRQWMGGGTSGGGSAAIGGGVTLTTGRPAYFLGESASGMVFSSGPDWIPSSAVRVVIDTVARGSNVGTVRVRLRAAAGGVTARLQDVTGDVTAGTSELVTGTGWTDVSFTVTFTPGIRTYELQVLATLADTDVAAVGYLE